MRGKNIPEQENASAASKAEARSGTLEKLQEAKVNEAERAREGGRRRAPRGRPGTDHAGHCRSV